MSTDNDDKEWSFELDEKAVKKSSKSNKKIKSTKEVIAKKGNGPLKVETPTRKKVSRTELARKEGGGKLAKGRMVARPASIVRRLLSSFVDMLIQAAFVAGCFLVFSMFPSWAESFHDIVKVVNDPILSSSIILTLVFWIFVFVFPQGGTGQSIGKKIFRIEILNSNGACIGPGVSFLRELILRPLSIASVLGILIIPLNKDRRALHDYLCGTYPLEKL